MKTLHVGLRVADPDRAVAFYTGIEVADPGSPDGSADFLTTWITDPDGNRIELVQWPTGHPAGLTEAGWS